MFTDRDIRPNVDLAKVNVDPHLYALGPLVGLKGEITVVDSEVFVSRASGNRAVVTLDPQAKAVFLVFSSVPAWRSIALPTNALSETDLAAFLQSQMPARTRSPFLVRGSAARGRYHIQNYQGKAKDLTHEAHDKAKVFLELSDTPVQLLGFFTNWEADGGLFVHRNQTTHIHVISDDRKSMGHLESITLSPGATLLLPETRQL
jgi:acetolactate decarboxylase